MGTCTRCREWWGCGFFEPRYYGYADISYYYGLFMMVNIGFAVWCFWILDNIKSSKGSCAQINVGLELLGTAAAAEALASFLLAVGMFVIMRSSGWACFALTSLGVFVVVFAGKFIAIVLATIWTWGENTRHCRSSMSHWSQANKFLIGTWVVFGFQLIVGTFYLFCCGLDYAIFEGLDHIRQDISEERDNFMDDTENQTLLTAQQTAAKST